MVATIPILGGGTGTISKRGEQKGTAPQNNYIVTQDWRGKVPSPRGRMANQNDGRPAMNVLDWDTLDHKRSSGQLEKRLKDIWYILCQKLDQKIPPERRYCGCNRQLFLVLCGVCLLVFVTLAIGLGIGLPRLLG